MAEILLSLTIIGVVAAITLPSLTGNINERTWNTQRKALYARMSQAISLMPALNGYGELKEASSEGASDAVDTATETFVTEGLSKVLKINNICDADHLDDCGVPNNITALDGASVGSLPATLVGFNSMFNSVYSGATLYSYSQIDTKIAAFETLNGESIAVYYNPRCVTFMDGLNYAYRQPYMCANFIYDLNGNKGPNTVGKDIGFMSVLYPTDSVVVAPVVLPRNAGQETFTDAGKLCKMQDSESRVPNREELAAMFYNKKLLNIDGEFFWTGVPYSVDKGYWQGFFIGDGGAGSKTQKLNVRCIKR